MALHIGYAAVMLAALAVIALIEHANSSRIDWVAFGITAAITYGVAMGSVGLGVVVSHILPGN
jgi:ABC-type taurine transport system substrate-binding protein